MNYKCVFLFTFFLMGCVRNEKKEIEKVSFISILLSRSGCGGIEENKANQLALSKGYEDLIYSYELDTNGVLYSSIGYGECLNNNLKVSIVNDSSENIISSNQLKSIFKLADKINKEEKYYTNKSPDDDWLIKLKLDNKIFFYYRGESLDTLNLDFLYLVDGIVNKSIIKHVEYPIQ